MKNRLQSALRIKKFNSLKATENERWIIRNLMICIVFYKYLFKNVKTKLEGESLKRSEKYFSVVD